MLDLRDISTFTDFFVICSASSEPQIKAIASSVTETLREKHGAHAHATNGLPASQWVVIDYIDVLVHILHQEKREFYALDDLWSDAPIIAWEEQVVQVPKKKPAAKKPATKKPLGEKKPTVKKAAAPKKAKA